MTKALTWTDLANFYDKECGGRKARTLPTNVIWEWAEKQTEKFYLSDDGGLHLIEVHNAKVSRDEH